MKRFGTINPIFTSRVKKVIAENYRVKTIEVGRDMEKALPGQFLMVWVPGAGERPMSIGNGSPLTISVADVGKVSSEICRLKEGDLISYRGPFGKPFMIPEGAKRILCVGGGYGVVPMYFLSKVAKENGIESLAVIGGRSERDIIWEKQLFLVCKEVFITTDDGSRGKKGTVMVEAQWLIESRKVDCVYACGPEKMMEALAKLCRQHSVPCQVSVERYMKCGMGVCGSCDISGKFACIDGPVMSGEEALSLPDFGKAHRDAAGVLHR
ncbi:MAG: dihydroorotate dehydrogenase electron transfer subunit [Candidatus Micrarchaeota archaeon]